MGEKSGESTEEDEVTGAGIRENEMRLMDRNRSRFQRQSKAYRKERSVIRITNVLAYGVGLWSNFAASTSLKFKYCYHKCIKMFWLTAK